MMERRGGIPVEERALALFERRISINKILLFLTKLV